MILFFHDSNFKFNILKLPQLRKLTRQRFSSTSIYRQAYRTFEGLIVFVTSFQISFVVFFKALKVIGYVHKTKQLGIYLSIFLGGKALCTILSNGLMIFFSALGVICV